MADILTQLQDAVDELANQFVASIYYVHKHHDLQTLGPADTVRQQQKNEGEDPGDRNVDPYPADVFKDGQKELAQDLILKEQQIEYLISILPGLENNEKEQEQTIQQLEEELKIAEAERKEAVKEKEDVLARLDTVLRSVKRP
ncbi:CSE2-domain-containing protein [Stipitochalara longipes BDJ]|nr:CSE2-domain-containing protein [Stipitochalara longipes BDJ]